MLKQLIRNQGTMESIRWAFKVGFWKPTKEQWVLATQCVQPEEKERIGRFVFQKDAKSAMIGRLLLRKAIAECLDMPFKEVTLSRTNKGKPYLKNDPRKMTNFNFNVSHQGDYAILAAESVHQVGVDVMQIEYPRGNRTVESFFSTMERQFTAQEWDAIRGPVDERDMLKQFYRHWCLKESYVKALGVGIGFSLQRLDFYTSSEPEPASINCDTRVCVDGTVQGDWFLEETMLDSKHCAAVALKQTAGERLPEKGTPFKELSFEELTRDAQPLTDADLSYWQTFSAKEERPGCRS